jgi:hypothetical protein
MSFRPKLLKTQRKQHGGEHRISSMPWPCLAMAFLVVIPEGDLLLPLSLPAKIKSKKLAHF